MSLCELKVPRKCGVHFKAIYNFQRLRLETPGWEVLDYERNPMSPAELERQRKKIRGSFGSARQGVPFFADEVIVDESVAVDANLAAMVKVSSLIQVLRLGGSYELVHQLWAQFNVSDGRVNIEVKWSRHGVSVGISTCSLLFTYQYVCIWFVACLAHHPQWDVHSDSVLWHYLGRTAGEL